MASEASKISWSNIFEFLLVARPHCYWGLVSFLLVVPQKVGFLNFYYLPVLAADTPWAGAAGVLTALCCILFVVFFGYRLPEGIPQTF